MLFLHPPRGPCETAATAVEAPSFFPRRSNVCALLFAHMCGRGPFPHPRASALEMETKKRGCLYKLHMINASLTERDVYAHVQSTQTLDAVFTLAPHKLFPITLVRREQPRVCKCVCESTYLHIRLALFHTKSKGWPNNPTLHSQPCIIDMAVRKRGGTPLLLNY